MSKVNTIPEVEVLLENNLRFLKSPKVLDYGCGECQYAELIKQLGGEYMGVDISEFLISKAKERGLDVCKPQEVSSNEEFDVLLLGNMSGIDCGMHFVNLRKQLKSDGILLMWDESFQKLPNGERQRTLSTSTVTRV